MIKSFYSLFTKFSSRINNSKYAAWLFLFISAQIFFLYFVKDGFIINLNGLVDNKHTAMTAYLIMTVNLLLTANTITFLSDAKIIIQDISRAKNLENINSCYDMFMIYLIFSVFISGGMAIFIILASAGWLKVSWQNIVLISEISSLLTFGFFLIADLCCYVCAKKIIEHCPGKSCPLPSVGNCPETARVAKFVAHLKLYILAVDAPGLFGIIFIIICGIFFSPILPQKFYWEGFIAGAIGLHITFSQAALAFLSVQTGATSPKTEVAQLKHKS